MLMYFLIDHFDNLTMFSGGVEILEENLDFWSIAENIFGEFPCLHVYFVNKLYTDQFVKKTAVVRVAFAIVDVGYTKRITIIPDQFGSSFSEIEQYMHKNKYFLYSDAKLLAYSTSYNDALSYLRLHKKETGNGKNKTA